MNRTGLAIALIAGAVVGIVFGIHPRLDIAIAAWFYDPVTHAFAGKTEWIDHVRDAATALIAELRAWVGDQLSPIAKPDEIRFTDNLPKTRSGKIMRRLLRSLARDQLVNVFVSITSLNTELKRTLEPRAASPAARLRVVKELVAAGVPTGVLVAPIIPAVNDCEIEDIVAAVAAQGAMKAGYVLLRLPHELKEIFRAWLDQHLPDRAEHVMSLIRGARDGRENDPRFGSRMVGSGAWAQLLRDRFTLACRRHGLAMGRMRDLSSEHFRPPARGGQISLPL